MTYSLPYWYVTSKTGYRFYTTQQPMFLESVSKVYALSPALQRQNLGMITAKD
ncbi:hypothetical protein [Photobacterium phosphoreum]|uniref:hypothetical protein n=1 Tax=Photobacterium phosphoreum TaxID=659 RepID=UPI0015E67B44|nr:hypothetical protein [Photobacterium phosphoreum]